jgi:hypothetical protein
MNKRKLEIKKVNNQTWHRIYPQQQNYESVVRSGRSFEDINGTNIPGSYGGLDYVSIGHNNSSVHSIARKMELGGYEYWKRVK